MHWTLWQMGESCFISFIENVERDFLKFFLQSVCLKKSQEDCGRKLCSSSTLENIF